MAGTVEVPGTGPVTTDVTVKGGSSVTTTIGGEDKDAGIVVVPGTKPVVNEVIGSLGTVVMTITGGEAQDADISMLQAHLLRQRVRKHSRIITSVRWCRTSPSHHQSVRLPAPYGAALSRRTKPGRL